MQNNDIENSDVEFISQRMKMVDEQIIRRGIKDSRVLNAMRSVPRHKFVPPGLINDAYVDGPLPIGEQQTISQPYIVASMTEELDTTSQSRVLEIGSGSGYQTAVLAEIVKEVYTIEIIPSLSNMAKTILRQMRYNNVEVMVGDGSVGWQAKAPFDGIIVTAAAPRLPNKLLEQLADNGTMVIPLEEQVGLQKLVKIKKNGNEYERTNLYAVRFVPMVGEIER